MTKRLRPLFLASLLSILGASSACTNQDGAKSTADVPTKTNGDTDPREPTAEEPKPSLPAGADLLAKHVEAAGGAEAIAKFETIHIESTVDTGKQKLRGQSHVWWKRGGSFYVEEEIEGVGKSRAGFDGEAMWAEDPISGLRTLEGKEAVSYIQSSMMFPGHEWRDHFEAANTKGKRSLDDGTEVWEVELVSKDGPSVLVGLDVNTGLLSYMKVTQVTAMGEMPFEAYAEGYEVVEGYQFAKKKRSVVTGLIELTEEVTLIEVNVEVDDSMFAFPSAREVVPADPAAQAAVEAPAPAAEAPAP